jgi:hypothetical protein
MSRNFIAFEIYILMICFIVTYTDYSLKNFMCQIFFTVYIAIRNFQKN